MRLTAFLLPRFARENERLAALNETLASRRAFVDNDYKSAPPLVAARLGVCQCARPCALHRAAYQMGAEARAMGRRVSSMRLSSPWMARIGQALLGKMIFEACAAHVEASMLTGGCPDQVRSTRWTG